MHGIVFASFRDYVAWRTDANGAAEVFGPNVYALSEAYPDEEFLALLARGGELTGFGEDDLLRDFGRFAGLTTFTRLYPAFFDISPDTRTFLLTIEARIHELVRATIPHATPPQLTVTPDGGEAVEIAYASPRQLCQFLEGLVAGTAAHYGERPELEKRACTKRGDPACVYRIRFVPDGAAG
jgi:Haem-NO-binding